MYTRNIRLYQKFLSILKSFIFVIAALQYPFLAGIKSLKRGKEDITLAKKMTECGVTLDNFEDFHEGDKILCVKIERTKQVVDWKL